MNTAATSSRAACLMQACYWGNDSIKRTHSADVKWEKNSHHCKGPWTEQERLKSAPTTCTWRQSIRLSPAYCCHLIINYLTLCKFYADEALFTYIFQIKRASESRSCDSSRPLALEKAHIFHSLKFVLGRLRHFETGWWSRFAVFFISHSVPS